MNLSLSVKKKKNAVHWKSYTASMAFFFFKIFEVLQEHVFNEVVFFSSSDNNEATSFLFCWL